MKLPRVRGGKPTLIHVPYENKVENGNVAQFGIKEEETFSTEIAYTEVPHL